MSATIRPSVFRRAAHFRLAVRIAWLYVGLVGFGMSLALMVKARLGLAPWDVLHQGIARHLGVELGWVVIAISAVVLLAWIPLRQRPGFGTVSNAVAVGLVVNAALAVLPSVHGLPLRLATLTAAITINGAATGAYIGAGLGAGPRDGLMIGLAARGHSLRLTRTAIEASVLLAGIALGGSVGIGTLAYAVAIGPLVHQVLPRLTLSTARPRSAACSDAAPPIPTPAPTITPMP